MSDRSDLEQALKDIIALAQDAYLENRLDRIVKRAKQALPVKTFDLNDPSPIWEQDRG